MAPSRSLLTRQLGIVAWVALTWGCAPWLASSQERYAAEPPKAAPLRPPGPTLAEAAEALPRNLVAVRSLDGTRLAVKLVPRGDGSPGAPLSVRYALTPDFRPASLRGCVKVTGKRIVLSDLPPAARIYLRFEAEGVDGTALSPVYSAAAR